MVPSFGFVRAVAREGTASGILQGRCPGFPGPLSVAALRSFCSELRPNRSGRLLLDSHVLCCQSSPLHHNDILTCLKLVRATSSPSPRTAVPGTPGCCRLVPQQPKRLPIAQQLAGKTSQPIVRRVVALLSLPFAWKCSRSTVCLQKLPEQSPSSLNLRGYQWRVVKFR